MSDPLSAEMKMPADELVATFSYLVSELKSRHPALAYLHLCEPRVNGDLTVNAPSADSLDFLADIWAPLPLLVSGGYEPKADKAEEAVGKYENSVVAYGRHFTSNPDLVARIKLGVEPRAYDRATFYVPGAENTKGYNDFPVEYGADGKL